MLNGGGGEAYKTTPEVVAGVPDESAHEARARARLDRIGFQSPQQPPGIGERVRPLGGSIEDLARVRREVAPDRVPPGSRALEEAHARQRREPPRDSHRGEAIEGGHALEAGPTAGG